MPQNINERLIAEIDAVLPKLPASGAFGARQVLTYIRGEITPEGLERREGQVALGDGSVRHLHEVAREHLRRINREGVRA